MSSPKLDVEALRKSLTPAQRSLVFKKVEVEQVDEDALAQLVQTGKIPQAALKKATIPSQFKHNRVIVEVLDHAAS